MIAALDPARARQLIAEARRWRPRDSAFSADPIAPLADQLEAALAEIERLRTRQQELLATIVRVTNETPFPDEIKGWTEQRAKLVAEVGSLRARVTELERSSVR